MRRAVNSSIYDTLCQAAATLPDGIKSLVVKSLNAIAATSNGREYLRELDGRYAGNGHGLQPPPNNLLEGFRCIDVQKASAFIILESPYPTPGMANGRAFFPDTVQQLWASGDINSELPLAFQAFLKMLLVAEDLLSDPGSADEVRQAVAEVQRRNGTENVTTLFHRAHSKGIYFLNASLVYEPATLEQRRRAEQRRGEGNRNARPPRNNVPWHEVYWRIFNREFLKQIKIERSSGALPALYLIGRLSENLVKRRRCQKITCSDPAFHHYEIPYPTAGAVNDFICYDALHDLFRPADLLQIRDALPLERCN